MRARPSCIPAYRLPASRRGEFLFGFLHHGLHRQICTFRDRLPFISSICKGFLLSTCGLAAAEAGCGNLKYTTLASWLSRGTLSLKNRKIRTSGFWGGDNKGAGSCAGNQTGSLYNVQTRHPLVLLCPGKKGEGHFNWFRVGVGGSLGGSFLGNTSLQETNSRRSVILDQLAK